MLIHTSMHMRDIEREKPRKNVKLTNENHWIRIKSFIPKVPFKILGSNCFATLLRIVE